jgi:hypothetical protein
LRIALNPERAASASQDVPGQKINRGKSPTDYSEPSAKSINLDIPLAAFNGDRNAGVSSSIQPLCGIGRKHFVSDFSIREVEINESYDTAIMFEGGIRRGWL